MTADPLGGGWLASFCPPGVTSARVPQRHGAHGNHLLDALPASDYERLAPHLDLIPMPLGDVIYESGVRRRYVYFPTTSIVSLLYLLADGAPTEIAIVGNEGMLGVTLFMGGETAPTRAVVQSAGHGYRLKAQVLKDEFRPLRSDDAPVAALHTGAAHPDRADDGL